jgi:hypothetical protein
MINTERTNPHPHFVLSLNKFVDRLRPTRSRGLNILKEVKETGWPIPSPVLPLKPPYEKEL